MTSASSWRWRLWQVVHSHRRADKPSRRRGRSFRISATEGLELRLVMSATAAAPAIQMLSATTTDSKSVSIEYQVNQAPEAGSPLQFGVYRSSDGLFDASDSLVDTFTPASPQARSVCINSTIPLAQGLPPYPEKPYVLVVANPGSASATTETAQTASFRVYTIGIVTHGGIQDTSWKYGPPWQLDTAYMMRHEGFDSVIAYNWVQQSSTPGDAIKQSPRLAQMVLDAASKFPANAPVDLEFIGHSEGTVVNTYALVTLQGEMTPQLKSGYIVDTLLDPHAANNNVVSGQQMSFGGVLGDSGPRWIVTDYQAEAKDPPPFFPSSVDQAQVFFEHSQSTAAAIYNLWGQVPVKSEGPVVHYYNLTDMGVTHSGKTGVNYWFRDFIAPTLGYQVAALDPGTSVQWPDRPGPSAPATAATQPTRP